MVSKKLWVPWYIGTIHDGGEPMMERVKEFRKVPPRVAAGPDAIEPMDDSLKKEKTAK
jgi:hypothetical protein